ncbi:uncharacterized protein LOC120188062 [Hibiscus syriacus]|uniref:uncharacterized protein LOC120188062 n=1 Tax=Hibiscus syriacus TaxID=106335 RepID=UPI001921DB13|nr:uncharacterized protein LOC120188062 [Hibiscus syriacus]
MEIIFSVAVPRANTKFYNDATDCGLSVDKSFARFTSSAGLSYIASGIGVPILMDSVTTSKTRLEFAKICVEISVDDYIPKSIDVILKDNVTTSFFIEVPWLPPRYRNCRKFGHNEKNCLVKSSSNPSLVQVWKKRANSNNIQSLVGSDKTQELATTKIPIEATQQNEAITEPLYVDSNIVTSHPPDGCPGKEIVTVTNPTEPTSSSKEDSFINQNSLPKKVRGHPAKEKASFAGSSNRYELLNSVDENSTNLEVPQRTSRIASKGVEELVKELKLKKNMKLEKVKSSVAGGAGPSRGSPLQ